MTQETHCTESCTDSCFPPRTALLVKSSSLCTMARPWLITCVHYGNCMLLYGTVTRRSRSSVKFSPPSTLRLQARSPARPLGLSIIRADESILGSLTSSPNVGPFKWPPSPAPSFTPVGTACHSTKKHKET